MIFVVRACSFCGEGLCSRDMKKLTSCVVLLLGFGAVFLVVGGIRIDDDVGPVVVVGGIRVVGGRSSSFWRLVQNDPPPRLMVVDDEKMMMTRRRIVKRVVVCLDSWHHYGCRVVWWIWVIGRACSM